MIFSRVCINIFNCVSGLERNFGEVARVPTISERKAGADGHERRGRKPKESEEGEKAGG